MLGPLPNEVSLETLKNLPFFDLAEIRNVNVALRGAVSTVIKQQVWALISTVIEPAGLMRVMEETDALISGSTVLCLFGAQSFTPDDLDIYVGDDADKLNRLNDYIVSRGFQRSDNGSSAWLQSSYGPDFISETRRYTRTKCHNELAKINIVATWCKSAFVPIVDFDVTWVMNAITAHGVLSLYPASTSMCTGVVAHIPAGPGRLSKYAQRKYYPSNPVTDAQVKEIALARHVHDKSSLFIPFDPDNKKRRLREVPERVCWSIEHPLATAKRPPYIFDSDHMSGLIEDVAF